MTTPPRIICVGDVDVDDMIAVDALPQADGKVNGRELGRTPGGMAANVAVGIARLGGCAALIGRVGDDEAGDFVLTRIAAEGVDVAAVARPADSQTFRCLVLLTPDGEKALIRLPTIAYLPAPAEIGPEVLSGAAHVHLTFGNPALAVHVLRLARAVGIPTSIDVEAADLPADHAALTNVLELVDLLFVNRRSRGALQAHLTRKGVPAALVTTLGAAGSRLEAPGERIDAPGFGGRRARYNRSRRRLRRGILGGPRPARHDQRGSTALRQCRGGTLHAGSWRPDRATPVGGGRDLARYSRLSGTALMQGRGSSCASASWLPVWRSRIPTRSRACDFILDGGELGAAVMWSSPTSCWCGSPPGERGPGRGFALPGI